MSERKILGFISMEGMLLLILGFLIFILPRLTSVTFNTIVGIAFIIYGIVKFVCSIINKDVLTNFICQIFLAVMIFVLGILLQIPRINIYWLMAFIGIYFVLESITSSAFISQIKNYFSFWHCKWCSAVALLIAGLVILTYLPLISFSTVAIITAICFVIKGSCKKMLGIVNANYKNYDSKTELYNK